LLDELLEGVRVRGVLRVAPKRLVYVREPLPLRMEMEVPVVVRLEVAL
jgi:hypothetical protein